MVARNLSKAFIFKYLQMQTEWKLFFHCKFDELGSPGPNAEVEAGHRYGQPKAPGSGTAGIDVQNSVLPVLPRPMGVPTDDDVKARRSGVQVQVF